MASTPKSDSHQSNRPAMVEQLLSKIERCIDYQNLYALEPQLNKCGLTIQHTSRNRMVLAKLRNGSPVTEEVITDYMFVGSLSEANTELTERAINTISDFVRTNYGTPDEVKNTARVWRNGLRMYGQSLLIANEDINEVASKLIVD